MNSDTQSYQEREAQEAREERKAFLRNLALGIMGVGVLIGGIWTGVAVDRVNDGNFGIGKGISGMYQEEVIEQGFSINFLTTVLEVDGKNNIVQISDIRPKDKDGVLLQDMDYNVTYNVNPERAVEFLRNQRDLGVNSDGTYTLGQTYVTKLAQRVGTEVLRDFSSLTLLDNPAEVENSIQAKLQERLDQEYGAGLFEVVNINVASVKVSDVIEQRIQNVAAQDAAAAAAQAQMRSLEKRGEAELAEAQMLKDISGTTGVSLTDLIEMRRIRALENLNNVPATVTVSADRPAGNKP